ncbi:MAG: hypothetical protein HY825_17255 [Acidobacteria bacterium]|nr:hypothetical protein [Acidobacteriota bacterium]
MRRGIVSMFLLASLASMPVCAAASASCRDVAAAPCCCGDESSCPCAHSQGEAPGRDPAAPVRAAAPEQLALTVGAVAVSLAVAVPCAIGPHDEILKLPAAGTALFVSNCAFRC